MNKEKVATYTPQGRDLQIKLPCVHFDLRVLASRVVENEFLSSHHSVVLGYDTL